ncbi:hypothetical protein G6F50_016191 [Rhizopus delemar]|uniref:Glycosyl hydrolase family 92 domain-containing protein n=1 Tax=Rhizopus delemar TaxID=936053 RepID=A0A9P6XTZ1_9FUNG|nr:hypothetical protein G6F50_016191 [Rhizopus delemar]
MADGLGHAQDAATLRERGRNWRKVWDPQVRDAETGFTGFPRPRTEDGQWYGMAVPVAGAAGRAGPGRSDGRPRAGRPPPRRVLRDGCAAGRPAQRRPQGVGGRAVQLLQPVPLQPEQRAGPALAVAVHADRPAVEDRCGGACRAAVVHQCAERRDRQR